MKEALDGVYDTLEHPLIPVLVAIERAGIRVDVDALRAQSSLVEHEMDFQRCSGDDRLRRYAGSDE